MLSVESFSRAQRRLHTRPAPRLPKLLPIPYTSPVDLFSPELRRNPYPAYAHMREASPVFREPTSGLWLVFGYADVKRVLTDHQAFSSRAGSLEWMLFQDPPRHSRMRALIAARVEIVVPKRERLIGLDIPVELCDQLVIVRVKEVTLVGSRIVLITVDHALADLVHDASLHA